MVLDVSLDHLKEDEVQLILKVLERDAKIQKQEDERKRRLQDSIRRERIPEKRLSIKLRTGEWMEEITVPGRAKQQRGTEIVRASIRRESSKKAAPQVVKKEEGEASKGVIENGHVPSPNHTVVKKEADEEDSNKISQPKLPLRKTSIRRKKLSQSGDKQVKFDTNKTKKFVYEPTPVDSVDGAPPDFVEEQLVPTIVVAEHVEPPKKDEIVIDAQPVEVTVITDDVPPVTEASKTYDSGVFASSTTFESYHNSVGKEIHDEGEQMAKEAEEKTEKTDAPKGLKKVRIKRKGSSRRKVGKITDDSSRDTLFNAPDLENAPKDVIEPEVSKVNAAAVDEVKRVEDEIEKITDAVVDHEEITKTVEEINEAVKEGKAEIEAKERVADNIIGEAAKEYDRLVEEEKHNAMEYTDRSSLDMHDRSQPKIDDGHQLRHAPEPIMADAKLITEQDITKEPEEPNFSPKPNLDLGFGDVLDRFSGKYEPEDTKEAIVDFAVNDQGKKEDDKLKEALLDMIGDSHAQEDDQKPKEVELVPEVPQPMIVSDIVGSSQPADTLEDVVGTTYQNGVPDVVAEKISEIMESADVPGPVVGDLVENVLEAATTLVKEDEHKLTEDREKTTDNGLVDKAEEKQDEAEQKPKKKVVKKVVKKKKKDDKEKPDGEAKEPSKAESTPEKDGDAEAEPQIQSRLQRVKTVRRKVVKKAPPPTE